MTLDEKVEEEASRQQFIAYFLICYPPMDLTPQYATAVEESLNYGEKITPESREIFLVDMASSGELGKLFT